MATHAPMPMARQPFAPLDSSRLQSLTSQKNRQNALATPGKRKAEVFEEDGENIDPIIFTSPKKTKSDLVFKDVTPTPKFILTDKPTLKSTPRQTLSPRPTLTARSPAKLDTTVTPRTAPAGRSPTRKRIGLLSSKHRASAPFTRVDPPRFGDSAAPFSIAAALSGTISSYGARQEKAKAKVTRSQPAAKASWFFDIHEDTPEEHMTNMIEHSTLTMDLSSDDEEAVRARHDRGKENVPPMDDASQTRLAAPVDAGRSKAQRRRRKEIDEGAIDVDRAPLGDLAAEDFYADGCDKESVVIVHDDEEAATDIEDEVAAMPKRSSFDFVSTVDDAARIDELMQKSEPVATVPAPPAAVLSPIDQPEEGWTVYESDSAKDA